jgi:hypothetical protein
VLSPKYLRTLRQPNRPQIEITGDRPCRGCGYNLRGLKQGGRCPECGLFIESAGAAPRIDLICSDEPAMRRRMQRGLLAATIGLGGMVAMRLWMIFPFPRPDEWIIIDIISLVFSIAWCIGVWMITPKALELYGQPMHTARRAARILALAWPVAFVGYCIFDTAGGTGTASLGFQAAQIGRSLGGVGVLVVLYMLVLPAYDAGNDDISKWLITAFWGLLFLSPLVGFVPRGIAPTEFGWVVYGFLAVFIVTWAIIAAIAVTCLWVLHRAATWKSGHLATVGQRDERIRETRAEIDREVVEKIRPLGDWSPTENRRVDP